MLERRVWGMDIFERGRAADRVAWALRPAL